MDAAGRLYFPADKSKRIQRKRYLGELEGETVDSLWDDVEQLSNVVDELARKHQAATLSSVVVS